MKTTHFQARNCAEVRAYLDSFLDNELLVETNHEVLKHLGNCEQCERVMEDRARIKAQLKRAVLSERAPEVLRDRIRGDIRHSGWSGFKFNMPLVLAATAVAAALVVAVGVFQSGRNHSLFEPAKLSINAEVSPGDVAGQILKVGFDDHVFCAIDHEMANRRFTADQMREELGPEYAGLLPVVKDRAPSNYEIVVGHRCQYQGREFAHLILRRGSEVLSLVVSQKQGEAFPSNEAVAGTYDATWHDVHVTGMETRRRLVFVVSSTAKGENQEVESSLAAAVSSFLRNEEA